MRLLVTGGVGFIGSNFVRYAVNKGYDVTVVDALRIGSNRMNLEGIPHVFVLGDVCNLDLMKTLVKETDAVIHFAAESHVDRSITGPKVFVESNVIGTWTVLEAIRQSNSNAQLVYIGTDEEYGDIVKGSFKEGDVLKPSNPYSASKASADMFVLAYVRTYGIDAVITRCTNNYGPYQFPEKLIPKTITLASKDMKIPIYGTGENVRDWIYVEDHCSAIDLVREKGEKGEIYNVAGGEEKTNLEVVKTVLDIMEKDRDLIEFVEDRLGHDIRYSLDSSKIRKLGWTPKYKFEDGIIKTVKWYLFHELKYKN